MRTLNGWVLTTMAMACTSCLPTIKIETDSKDKTLCSKTNHLNKFTVPSDVPVALWRIDNQCGLPVTVEVKDFKYGSDYRAPVLCLGHPPTVAPGKKGWIACVVRFECREEGAYDYSVYVNTKMQSDPQVVLKKDPPGTYDALPPCPQH
jgi:hypothetical protein